MSKISSVEEAIAAIVGVVGRIDSSMDDDISEAYEKYMPILDDIVKVVKRGYQSSVGTYITIERELSGEYVVGSDSDMYTPDALEIVYRAGENLAL